MLTCVERTGSVVVSQVFFELLRVSSVAWIGGSLGHGEVDVHFG